MQASEIYSVGHAAYNGSDDARRAYFKALAPIAKTYGKVYGVLPSLILAKSALESGYASDLYEEVLEDRYGIHMAGKAQNHNNILAINGFADNKKYLNWLPIPFWDSYKTEFIDYGTHLTISGDETVKLEPWKEYYSIDDCIEDWCANMRYQAEKNRKPWGMDIRTQLLAIESFTPEGVKAGRRGMHFGWQDQVLDLYEKFGLWGYDKEVQEMPEKKITAESMDKAIKDAYEYAHQFCNYGPTDRFFPPMEDGLADCVGLALRALYTLGHNNARHNINEIGALCEMAGMRKTERIEDVASRHCVVLMNPKGDSRNVAHVYYSLGGQNINSISKYDLGSQTRIESSQPFANVPVNEWADRRDFLCAYYVDDVPGFWGDPIFTATTKKAATLREIAGKGNKAICDVPKGVTVKVYAAVNTNRLSRWFYVSHDGHFGFCYFGSLSYKRFNIPKDKKTVTGTPDNSLTCRVGAGVEYPVFKLLPSVPNGTKLRIINRLTSSDGTVWYNVYKSGLVFFVSGVWLV